MEIALFKLIDTSVTQSSAAAVDYRSLNQHPFCWTNIKQIVYAALTLFFNLRALCFLSIIIWQMFYVSPQLKKF